MKWVGGIYRAKYVTPPVTFLVIVLQEQGGFFISSSVGQAACGGRGESGCFCRRNGSWGEFWMIFKNSRGGKEGHSRWKDEKHKAERRIVTRSGRSCDAAGAQRPGGDGWWARRRGAAWWGRGREAQQGCVAPSCGLCSPTGVGAVLQASVNWSIFSRGFA